MSKSIDIERDWIAQPPQNELEWEALGERVRLEHRRWRERPACTPSQWCEYARHSGERALIKRHRREEKEREAREQVERQRIEREVAYERLGVYFDRRDGTPRWIRSGHPVVASIGRGGWWR